MNYANSHKMFAGQLHQNFAFAVGQYIYLRCIYLFALFCLEIWLCRKKAVPLQSQSVMEAGEIPAQTRCCISLLDAFRICMSLAVKLGRQETRNMEISQKTTGSSGIVPHDV